MKDRDRSPEALREAAAAGDIEAQTVLGTYLVSREGNLSGQEEGIKWLVAAAQGEGVTAMFNLGIVFERGLGAPRNPDEAALWFWQAAERGDSGARAKISTMLLKGTGFSPGSPTVRAIEASARKGSPFGQFFFARLYLEGAGVEPDDREAENWFRHAAAQGEPGAVFHLGEMMVQGRVLETSLEEAASLIFDLGMSFLAQGDLVKSLDCAVSIRRLESRHFLADRLEEEIERANRSRMGPG